MTTNEEATSMVARLRAGDLCDVELAPKAADMITALVAERDKALDTVKRVQAAARTLDVTRQQIADTYARNSAINKEAVETLDSERAANAILTAELDATREALAKFKPEWFYNDGYSSEVCHHSPAEAIDELYLDAGEHVVSVDCAGPYPSIWCAVHVLTDEEMDQLETDDRIIMTEHTSEAEARATLAKGAATDE